jgi:putative hemolysin
MDWVLGGFIFFLIGSIFFSGSETVILCANRFRLRHQRAEGSKEAEKILSMLDKPELLLVAILVGNNLSNVAISSLATFYFELHIPKESFFAINIPVLTSLVVTPLLLFFGEILPKNLSHRFATEIVYYVYRPLEFFILLFRPAIFMVKKCTDLVMFLAGIEMAPSSNSLSRKEFMYMMKQSVDSGVVHEETGKMIRDTFEFQDTLAKEVMVPLMEMCAISVDNTRVVDFLDFARRNHFTRYPVFADRIDRIIGYVNVYEVLSRKKDDLQPLRDFVRPISFVPNSLCIDKLFVNMRKNFEPMVILVDEYGGCDGLVTVEDIIEELMGVLPDEYDDEEPELQQCGPNTYIVDASMDIDDFNEELGLSLPEGPYETVAGFLNAAMEKIPSENEEYTYGLIHFRVLKREYLAITSVEVKLLSEPPPELAHGSESEKYFPG